MMKLTFFVVVLICFSHVQSSISDILSRDSTRAVPVQMDMKSKNGITICTGSKRTINCREGANMAVTNAFWGRLSDKTCPSDDGDPVTDCDASPDTLALIKKKCEGRRECDLTAKHNLLQNPGSSHCPGVNKYLVVNYTCMPESKGVTLCDSEETTLACDAGWVMQLADVFWGRRASASVCGLDEGLECDASEVASKFLKKKCNGRPDCLVQADADILDTAASPCQSTSKYLLVNYICSPPKDSAGDADDSKSIKETSSKELMGLLEKHITEIKVKEPAAAAAVAAQSKPLTLTPISAAAIKPAPVSSSLKQVSPAARTNAKSSNPDNKDDDSDDSKEKKSNKPSSKPSVEGPPSIDDNGDTSSVRSILSRAKNILKTLDIDQAGVRRKRFRIARPDKKSNSNKNNTQKHKKSKVTKLVANEKKSKVNAGQKNGYPNSFILRSWYGY